MELNIYFINVGQGDTILIDWTENPGSEKKYALIDCNFTLNRDIAPLTKHIDNEIKDGLKCFEFVLLTHPHTDHFSGFNYFLDYCEKNSITINSFYHTSFLTPVFLGGLFQGEVTEKMFEEGLTASVNIPEDKDELVQLFHRLLDQSAMNSRGFIKSVVAINAGLPIEYKSMIIKVLSPTGTEETAKYLRKTFNIHTGKLITLEQRSENNPHANYLSSFLQIYQEEGDWQILLCSDVNKYTLKRIRDNQVLYNDLRKRKLIAVQVPHHGSDYNHDEMFWNNLREIKDCEAIISVGNTYGHPGIKTVTYFNQNFKAFHATNLVGGYKKYYEAITADYDAELIETTLALPGIEIEPEANILNLAGPRCCGKRLKIITENHQLVDFVVYDED